MKKQKQKKIPTSEAALRRIVKKYGDRIILIQHSSTMESALFSLCRPEPYALCVDKLDGVIWCGRLSDLYRKRKPLKKGVMKKLKRAIR